MKSITPNTLCLAMVSISVTASVATAASPPASDSALNQPVSGRDQLEAALTANAITRAPACSGDEQRVLVKYVGWGGLPQVFASPLPPN